MIKARVSIKELRQEPYLLNGSEKLRAQLSNLGFAPEWYTCSQYGWDEDIYHIGRYTYISIGYRQHGKRCLTQEEEEYLLLYKDKGTFIVAFNKLVYNKKENKK